MDFIVDEMKNRKISKLFIVHANHEERANLLKEKTKDLIDPKDVIIAEFGPVVGTHLGPGNRIWSRIYFFGVKICNLQRKLSD